MKKVITYGTYDLLHVGHIKLLKRARELGDYLIVALSTDEFNALKNKIESSIENIKVELAEKAVNEEIKNTKQFDYSLPVDTKTGSLNPRTIIQKQVVDIFKNMGFVIEDGREVETEYNNFESVNVAKNHPARGR